VELEGERRRGGEEERMEGPEREEGWRHGNSGLAFNVPCGVSEDTRARNQRASGFKEGPVARVARLFFSPRSSSAPRT